MTTGSSEQHLRSLQEENEKLRHSLNELSVLNDIAVAISSSQSLNKIIDLIVHKCIRYFTVEQAAVLLLEEKEQTGFFRTLVRQGDQSRLSLPFRLNEQLTGWMIKHRQSLLINDLAHDTRFSCGQQPGIIHSLLSVPLMLKGKMIGLICLFNKKDSADFEERDKRLLSIIASESAQVIDEVKRHMNGAPQADDITIVAIKPTM